MAYFPPNDKTSSGNITTQNLNPNSGTATANSTVHIIEMDGRESVSIHITANTLNQGLTPQFTIDGTNWLTATVIDIITKDSFNLIPSNQVGSYEANSSGWIGFRLSANTAVTGSASIFIRTTYATGILSIDNIIDQPVVGASAQTAVVNNILTPSSGTNGSDMLPYRSACVQVVSTGTAGTFIFEGSNSPTANFQAIPVWNQVTATGTPIVAAITATASQIGYIFPRTFRYIRLRIVSTITGGSIQAISTFSQAPFSPTYYQVSNATAANLNATVIANGSVAHSTATTANPIQMGGRVVPTTIATQDATLVAGDASYLPVSTGLQTITKEGATSELDFTIPVSSVGTVNTVQGLVASPAQASVRNYIKSIRVRNNTLGTSGTLLILDSIVSVTSIAITTGLATTGTHDLRVGDAIIFTALAGGTGVTVNQIYYVTTVASATTFNFSATPGGANVVPSVAYTGTSMYRVFDQFVLDTVAGTQLMNYSQPLRGIANTITNFLIPTSLTTGTVFITVNGYRGF
jgi:hypothetical protein